MVLVIPSLNIVRWQTLLCLVFLSVLQTQSHDVRTKKAKGDGGMENSMMVVEEGFVVNDIQVVSLTDTHSWAAGHGFKEQQYNADYGDVLSFVQHLRHKLAAERRDLFFVFNGDLLDGTGLTQTGDPSNIATIEEKMKYDALTLGNHDLYRSDVIQHFSESRGFFEQWGSRLITSNVVRTDTMEPLGNRYRILQGQFGGNVLVFGFLYDMKDASPDVTVLDIHMIVEEDWFRKALQISGIDAVVVLAHMGATDNLVDTILNGIRRYAGQDIPVQFLTGHTHKRRVNRPDGMSSNLEGGCFMETIGFTSFPKRSTIQKLTNRSHKEALFHYKLIDANRETMAQILGEDLLVPTAQGKNVSTLIATERRKLGLDEVVGCADKRYRINVPLDNHESLWGLFDRQVVPQFFDENTLLFLRYKHFRYDLFPGKLVRDEIIGMAPFNESLQLFSNVPAEVLLKMNQTFFEEYPGIDGLPGYLCLSRNNDIDPTRSYTLVTGMHEAGHVYRYMQSIYSGIEPYTPLNITLEQLWIHFFRSDPLCPMTTRKRGRVRGKHVQSLPTQTRTGYLEVQPNDMEESGQMESCFGDDCQIETEESFSVYTRSLLVFAAVALVIAGWKLPRTYWACADREDNEHSLKETNPFEQVQHSSEEDSSIMTKESYVPCMACTNTTFCPNNKTLVAEAFKLSYAVIGIQAAYLLWGYLQELIMTTQYQPTKRVPDGKFPSATFCVFSNRLVALIVALVAVRLQHGRLFPGDSAPLVAFFPCALSNTISSWSQYSALRYVSFPVVNVFKSCKIIPVMIMGYFVQRVQYPRSQYFEALLISLGVAVFSIHGESSSPIEDGNGDDSGLIGLAILLLFITSDSFTSQWQSRVYNTYGRQNVDSYQMMLGVNVSALFLTTTALLASGDMPAIAEFLSWNPGAMRSVLMLSVASTFGQVCIFYTIKEFGPIVFTIIMTTRQMFSIFLSAAVFGHSFSSEAVIGGVIVFAVLFYQIYRKFRERQESLSQHSMNETEDEKFPSTGLLSTVAQDPKLPAETTNSSFLSH